MPPTHSRIQPVVILGAGYTSRFLYPLAIKEGWHTLATSRTPALHLPHVSPAHRIEFDLLRPKTWPSVPSGCHLIWCFPAIPQNFVSQFLDNHRDSGGRLIVLGSTSAYKPDSDTLVNENAFPRLSLPRVQSEEFLRTDYGAIILRLAGLFGPGRNVLDWMRRGKVKNTHRFVNLVHIEDVAAICLRALTQGKDGEVYIVSDGTPRRWSEIFSTAEDRWGYVSPSLSPSKDSGKRLSNEKLLKELHYQIRFPDLYRALADLEANRPPK